MEDEILSLLSDDNFFERSIDLLAKNWNVLLVKNLFN